MHGWVFVQFKQSSVYLPPILYLTKTVILRGRMGGLFAISFDILSAQILGIITSRTYWAPIIAVDLYVLFVSQSFIRFRISDVNSFQESSIFVCKNFSVNISSLPNITTTNGRLILLQALQR